MSGISLTVWDRDMTSIFSARLERVTIDQLREYYDFDYEDLRERKNLADLRVANISGNSDVPDGWEKYVVGWTASLNAYDHEIQMIYYDVIVISPDGDQLTRHYQIRGQECVA